LELASGVPQSYHLSESERMGSTWEVLMKTRRVRGGAAVDLPMTPMIEIVLHLSVVSRRAD